MDVNTAFIQSELVDGEELYMDMPPIYEWLLKNENATDFPKEALNTEYKTVKLVKSLYGAKQAPRIWNRKIDNFFKEHGLIPLKSDPCCYIKTIDDRILIICIYVDDLLICGSNNEDIKQFKIKLNENFKMTDLGAVKYLLGMEIIRNKEKKLLYINQTSYIKSILEEFGMMDCNSSVIPMDPKFNLIKQDDIIISNDNYRKLIGTLLYLSTHTRPDISYAVSYLSRFVESPTANHWNAGKRILRYLKGTMNLGIIYDGKLPFELTGSVDADWASDVNSNRKSTTGYIFMLCGGPINWKSRKQLTVALSSCESEYIALSETIKELVWIIGLLKEMNCTTFGEYETNIKIDNMAAKYLAENDIVHNRSKHIDIKYHFIKEKLHEKLFKLEKIRSEQNQADLFTKPLSACLFIKHRDGIGVHDGTN